MEGGVGVGGDGEDGGGDVTVGGTMMGMAEGGEDPGAGVDSIDGIFDG